MAMRRIDTIDELGGISDRLCITCRSCGRVAIYQTSAIVSYFRYRAWSTLLAHAGDRFVCSGSLGGGDGCGKRGAHLSAVPRPPRPDPPPAPIAIHPPRRRGRH